MSIEHLRQMIELVRIEKARRRILWTMIIINVLMLMALILKMKILLEK